MTEHREAVAAVEIDSGVWLVANRYITTDAAAVERGFFLERFAKPLDDGRMVEVWRLVDAEGLRYWQTCSVSGLRNTT